MAVPFYYNAATNELELTADPSPLRTSLGKRFGLNEISTARETLSPTKSYTAESVLPSQFDYTPPEEMEDIKQQAGVGELVKDGGRIGMAKGMSPSERWMRDYFFDGKGGYDTWMSFKQFQRGPGVDLWYRHIGKAKGGKA